MAGSAGPSKEEILHLTALAEIFSGFAHEIAQPLNAVMIASQVIQLKVDRSELPDSDKAFVAQRLGIIASQVQRATEIVEGLRGFGRKDQPMPTTFSLKDALFKIYNLMEQQFLVRGIELTVETDADCPPMAAATTIVEAAVIHGLSFARDLIKALAAWHETNNLPYRKHLLVSITCNPESQRLSMKWRRGNYPDEPLPVDPAVHLGLSTATASLAASGGRMDVDATELAVILPA